MVYRYKKCPIRIPIVSDQNVWGTVKPSKGSVLSCGFICFLSTLAKKHASILRQLELLLSFIIAEQLLDSLNQ